MSTTHNIVVIPGDGIGPEVTVATQRILAAVKAPIHWIEHLAGLPAIEKGLDVLPKATLDAISLHKIALKGPCTTPVGKGFKSINVQLRKTLNLYAAVRPVRSLEGVATRYTGVDLVIFRENTEGLYSGIENEVAPGVVTSLKVATELACTRIAKYAFKYASERGRKKVTVFHKANIMKLTDGLFHKVFDEIAPEYPQIENEHWIVDIGAAKLADTPEIFDVIVMPNLYGDILSDVAAQIAGSVGLAGSANIGVKYAMFEAIHGSAPRRAGQNLANPSGLLLGAVMMLVHIDQADIAERVHNAWLRTLEDGIHTYDVYTEGVSTQKVGTKEFAQAVVDRIGKEPEKLKPARYSNAPQQDLTDRKSHYVPEVKEQIGVDIFINLAGINPEELGPALSKVAIDGLKLVMMSNRGVKVWPNGFPDTLTCDTWRCRFMSSATENGPVTHAQVIAQLQSLLDAKYDFVKYESLCTFNGRPDFSLGQGQ